MGLVDALVLASSSVSFLGAVAVLLVTYIMSSTFFSLQKDRKEPPGPRPLPLLGNLLQLDLGRMYFSLVELSKKYGSVFTVYLGPKKVVVLAGYKTVKEAFVNHAEEFGEREKIRLLHEFTKGNGVVWANGDSWKETRRFVIRNLKDFGMGKKVCGEKIIEESHHLVEEIKKFKGEVFDTSRPLCCAAANVICSMVFGNRFEYDDPTFTSLIHHILKAHELLGGLSSQIFNLFGIGKWFPKNQEFLRVTDSTKEMVLQLVTGLEESLQPNMCRSLVDALLVKKQTLEDAEISNSHFHNENILMTVTQLFSAGTDTTATTLMWGLLLMAKYPQVQDQVQDEVRQVIGGRQVQPEDRRMMPVTDAVIHEVQRFANIVPMSLPHRTNRDVIFQGHTISKGTTLFPLLGSVLYDESEWEKPHSFYPAHFLDKDGKFVKRDAFMPFFAGQRQCLGENLARMELFIFFTTLLQRFRFTPPPGVSEEELALTPVMGLGFTPSQDKLCAVSLMSEE
ncbi:cytochrome P450 2K1-like isoform X1 [Betta splendens]|uniref:Cytochrome P450 2K1-like isoform X1 n=1 Tax=Betta splendens TaxID=158456 RepID=A0A9W2XLF0_BETSP|nr:cytochrome P450 2K1-like isoform X1 [Betta splendens]